MSSDEGAVLPRQIEKLFKQYGVIKPTGWPKLDGLLKQVAARKMRATVEVTRDGGATARVFAGTREFTGSDTAPERALSRALAEALRATGPRQLALTDDDDESDDEEDDEPFPEAVVYRSPDDSPAPVDLPPQGAKVMSESGRTVRVSGDGIGEEMIWNDAGQCWYGKETGERFEGIVADMLKSTADAVQKRKLG